MTPRERIKATIHFRKPDILPWYEEITPETLIRWIKEGLPIEKLTLVELLIYFDGLLLLNDPTVKGFDPYSYFGFDNLWGCAIPIDMGPIPRFKRRVISENDRYTELLTDTGTVARRLKKAAYLWYNMPMWVGFPVKDRESWEDYKKRLNPNDPRRYPKDWDKDVYLEFYENYQGSNTIFAVTGFYGFGAQLMGIPTFNLMFYKDPELIHDMAEHWEFFTKETIREAIETLKDRIDMIFWWEDMAYKHGPCISPKLYREFFLPHYTRVTDFLKKNKIDRVMMDSDGNINPLLDLIIEAGITGLWPLEVNSSMDAVAIRKKYGEKLFLAGNLDKGELAKGGEAMRKEVDSKVPILKETSGYLPGMDHIVPAEFTLKKFKEYSEYIKKHLPY